MDSKLKTCLRFAAILCVVVPAVQAGSLPPGMAHIPDGLYRPLYQASEADRATNAVDAAVVVPSFFLDRKAVTNADYLDFVQERPKWKRSLAPELFADENYLAHWSDDERPGELAPADVPVVNVSWFAAMAYCRANGKSLPTVAQWERAGAASDRLEYAIDDPEFSRRILQWYASPADRPLIERARQADYSNLFGVENMHGLIWEWTRDFNTALVTGESRGDSGLQRQLFCGSGSIGAADPRDYPSFMRYAFRSSLEGHYTVGSLGFRCALRVN